MAKFASHIEDLKIYLDSVSNPSAMKTRLGTMESLMTAKQGDEHYPTRAQIMGEASFMVKNKERVTKAVGAEKYMEVFHGLIKFLEKHPPENKKKKPQAKAAADAFEELMVPLTAQGQYTLPTWIRHGAEITYTYTGAIHAVTSTWNAVGAAPVAVGDSANLDATTATEGTTATGTTITIDPPETIFPTPPPTLDQATMGGDLVHSLQELTGGGYNHGDYGSLTGGAALRLEELNLRANEFLNDDHEDGWG